MNPGEIPNLAKAINRWLSYQLLCGRGTLLSEGYLGQPTAEFLLHHHPGEFESEIDHPVLNRPGPGRPRQIDYVLRTPQTGVLETAIEHKWITEGLYDKQRIMNDLLRLECVREPRRYVKRYLVVAGKSAHFDNNFKNMAVNTGAGPRVDFTKTLLSFDIANANRAIPVRNCVDRFRDFYVNFSDAFNADVPTTFKTMLLGLEAMDDVTVGIWQVGSARNRTAFAPRARWP